MEYKALRDAQNNLDTENSQKGTFNKSCLALGSTFSNSRLALGNKE